MFFGEDGILILRKTKKNKKVKNIPVIKLNAKDIEEMETVRDYRSRIDVRSKKYNKKSTN